MSVMGCSALHGGATSADYRYESIVTGIKTSVGMDVDHSLQEYKQSYVSAMELTESTDFRLEADMKMGLDKVVLLPGVYTKTSYAEGDKEKNKIVSIERFNLNADDKLGYELIIYRDGGSVYKWTVSGNWRTEGEVLIIDYPRGDSRVLPYDVAQNNFVRCILTEKKKMNIKIGCNSKSYLSGGDYYTVREKEYY